MALPKRVFGIVVGTIFILMVLIMLGQPKMYPSWTVLMMAATGFGALWYGFGDLLKAVRSP